MCVLLSGVYCRRLVNTQYTCYLPLTQWYVSYVEARKNAVQRLQGGLWGITSSDRAGVVYHYM